MSLPRSRALARLDAAIAAAARSPAQCARLRAERVGVLARLGQVEAVQAEIQSLRDEHGEASDPAIAAALHLAAGLADLYRDFGSSGRDHLRRAHALAGRTRDRALIALTAASLSHGDYVYGDFDGIARHAAEALQEAGREDHAARSRASLVIAQSYHWAGRADLATPWYRRAHEHAVALGDESTLGALMINRAWVAGNQVRLAAIFGPREGADDETSMRQALLAAESSEHFNEQVGRRALRSMARLTRAQLLLAQGDASAALSQFEAALPGAADDGLGYLAPLLRADVAWCLCKLGRHDDARAAAEEAAGAFNDELEDEDLAAAHGRLAQVFAALGDAEAASRHEARAREQLAVLAERQQRLTAMLDAALLQVPGL